MHIAIVTGMFKGKSGVGTSVREWVAHLAKNGYYISVFAPDVDSQDSSNKIRYVKITNIPVVPQIIFFLIHLLLLNRKEKIDVVHTHDSIAYLASYIFCRLTRTPSVFTFHASIFSHGREIDYNWVTTRIYRFTNRFVARRADKLICVSREMIECARIAGASEDKLVLFHNPIDLSLFQSIETFKKENICLYVGALRPVKGVEYLIKAIPKVVNQVPDVKFVLVGDGPSQRQIEQLIEKLDIGDVVRLIGYVPRKELHTYYQKARIFVMPSVNEPQGIVVLEAMACGLPVVASNVGGVPEMVKEYNNGLLAEPCSIDSLAEKIILLLQDEKLRKMCSEGALDTAMKFSWNRNIDSILNFYSSLLEQSVSHGQEML